MPSLSLSASLPKSATVHDVPVASDEIGALGPDLERDAGLQGFDGKVGQTLVLAGGAEGPMRVLVGIGPRSSVDAGVLRKAAAAFVRAVGKHKVAATTLAEDPGDIDRADAIRAVCEGIGLASYRYTALKTGPEQPLRRVVVVSKGAGSKAAFQRGVATVDAVCLARDLVNEPGGSMTPEAFTAVARTVCKDAGVKLTVWDEKRIAKEKLGGVMAVNQGSTHPARFLTIDYKPTGKPLANVALVGKGITFDSGGLSIKTSTGMMTMKVDMTGGAVVLAVMSLLPALGVKTAVTGYIPLTDNMINGDAIRPGDVFTARNGKTVEVLNTDAEGRLILADALSIAAEKKPDAIIDIATLTGSVSAALGVAMAGLMGTDESLIARLEAASAPSGEQVWHLPLPTEYRKQLDSVVADVKNIGSGAFGGALVAGLFLKEFTADLPWAHIDLGMSAMSDADDGVKTKGGTAFGVRLIASALEAWS